MAHSRHGRDRLGVVGLPRRLGLPRASAVLFWSGGKDAAFALREVRRQGRLEVVALLTTTEEGTGRVAMHGVRDSLLIRQAAAVGVPLLRVELPPFPPNAVYESAVGSVLDRLRSQGVRYAVFGDLFLEDIRAYREQLVGRHRMRGVFPLWGRTTRELAREMVESGLEARIVCVDRQQLSARWTGHAFDRPFLRGLPPTVDPCGENGEFHTFVTAGPMLAARVPTRIVRRWTAGRFARVDLAPVGPRRGASANRSKP